MSYYQHINDFEGIVPVDNVMPADVKRLISHTKNNYHKRYYFFSPSQRTFYRYYPSGTSGYAYFVYHRAVKKGVIFTFIPDEDDGTSNTPQYRDLIYVSDRFIKRIEHMDKLVLPKQK